MAKGGKPGWSVSGIVHAPVEAVWGALLIEHPNLTPDVVRAAGKSRGQPYSASVGEKGAGKMQVEINPKAHTIAVEGEWWYRGVYRVEPDTRGAKLIHEVYNIAPGVGRIAAQLVQGPQHARSMGKEFGAVLKSVGERVGRRVEFTLGK